MAVKFDTLTNGYDRTLEDGCDETKLREGNWQVIFKTKAGLDYCRETKPSRWTRADIKRWAEMMCEQNKSLGGAVIQRW